MANRFTLTREIIGNAQGAAGNRGDGSSRQWRLTDTTTGKFWLQPTTWPMTGIGPGNSASGESDICAIIQTMLTALAPTA